MKPTQIFSVLDMARTMRKNGDIFNPCFVSAPGLGKTEMTQEWARKNNLKCIVLTLSCYDPPDFKGFPHITMVNGRQRLSFATPDFWPEEGEGIIILEELNRAPTAIMQCIMSLTDKRRGFDGYTLPSGWIVAGCINPENAEYDVNVMDPALKDRFEMFNISYDKNTFLNFMKENDWHKDIVSFVEAGLWNYKAPEDLGNVPGVKYTSPRTLSKLNALKKCEVSKKDELEFYQTILGNNTGKDFYDHCHDSSPVMYKDIISNTSKAVAKLRKFSNPDNYQNGIISLTIADLLKNPILEESIFVEVVKALPVDQAVVLIRDTEFHTKDDTLLARLIKKYPEIKENFKSVVKYGK